MTKGYWIGHVTVADAKAYEDYRAANAEAFANYGGRFLVRGGEQVVVEGDLRQRAVVIEFPSFEAAINCYHSAEYKRAMALRKPASHADLCIVEGWPGH